MSTTLYTYPHSGVNLRLDNWRIYPDANAISFHLAVDDPRFTHPDAGPGLHFTAHSSPLSANYNPRQFNRILAAFHDQDQLLDWQPIPEHDRHITKRLGLIVTYLNNGGHW